MENASKALLMAGGVMLTMLVVSILMYGWGTFSEYQAELDRIEEADSLAKFNQQFTNYNRDDVLGYELLSLINKVIDYNQRKSEEGTTTGSVAGNDAEYEPIDITINMGSNVSSLKRNIEIPKRDYSNTKTTISSIQKKPVSLTGIDVLFEEDAEYTINTAVMKGNFKTRVVDKIKKIESVTENPQFGGATGIQNLVKNIDTIYNGAIINYNGIPIDKNESSSWYDMNYIITRYKTLTGVEMSGSEENKIDRIRDKEYVIKVLQYYEYSQFKKGLFNCTNVEYSEVTGRVKSMSFNFTGVLE